MTRRQQNYCKKASPKPYENTAKSQRIHQQIFLPSEVAIKGVTARGVQMTSKDIEKLATEKPRWWQDDADAPKGMLG